ncbi:MAG: glycosyltransferase family 9 protein [Myxococcales bacterium]|nr:glycosyltransferase family 9 protein [Myxococcales bacterium]
MKRLLWRWIAVALRRFAGRRRGEPQAQEGPGSEAPRLLVIRVDERLGNLILTAPLVSALRAAYPDARLGALVAEKKAAIWHRLADLDELLTFEKRWLFRAPRRLFRLLRQLRAQRFDVVIDASHAHAFSATHMLLAAACDAPMVVAHRRGPDCGIVTHAVPDPGGYEVARKLSLLAPLGIGASSARPLFPGGPRWPSGRQLDSNGRRTGAFHLLVHAGGRKRDHRFPLAHYALLLRRLQARFGPELLFEFLWGPGEESLAQELQRELGSGTLAPPTDVEQMAERLAHADGLLCGDTGPMHLAVAVGTPTCALFVRSDARRWGPSFEPHLALSPTPFAERCRMVSLWMEKRFRACYTHHDRRETDDRGSRPIAATPAPTP